MLAQVARVPGAPWILSFSLVSCAHVTHEAVESSSREAAPRGIRYFESSPYLLLHADGRGGVHSEILWLPDSSKLRCARPVRFLARHDTRLDFSNGVLTRSASDATATELPRALLAAVDAALPDLLALNAPTAELPSPALYKIVTRDGRVAFRGGPARTSVRVSLPAVEVEP